MLEASRFAQAANVEAVPLSLTIAGAVVAGAGILGPLTRIRREDGGGFIKVRVLSATVLKTLLAAAPVPGDQVLLNGQAFTVEQCGGANAADAVWRFTAQYFPK